MAWPAKLWRWGIVLPATLAAFAGGIADVVTGTLVYWPLLAPSYFVILIAVWRDTDARAEKRRRDRRLAEPEAEAEADGFRDEAPPPLESEPELLGRGPGDATVTEPPRLTGGSILVFLGQGFVRLLVIVTVTSIYLVAIWGVIAVATWARPYWYVYGPGLAVIAVLAWLIYREGAVRKSGRHARRDGARHP
jgi:hypothetical protein